jgi:hypothetical protein
MRRCCWSVYFALGCALCLIAGFGGTAIAADIYFRSDTLLRSFERDTATTTDDTVAPIYEYLQFDAGALKNPGLSFHFYGWGRGDLADSSFYRDETAGEVLYGYLQYTRPTGDLSGRLGRFHVFEGVANETVDGIWLKSALGNNISGSVYVGQPVGLSTTDSRSGDSIYGARLSHRSSGAYEAGVSFKSIQNDSDTAETMLGIDLSLFALDNVSFYGNSVFNVESGGFAEHSYEARFGYRDIRFRAFAEMFDYEDYFDTGANAVNPFRILAGMDEQLYVFGTDATWKRTDTWSYGGKLKFYNSDRNDTSTYASLLTVWHGDSGMNQVGGEVGYLAAGADLNDFILLRLYGYWDELSAALPIDFISADLVCTFYDQPIYTEDTSVFVSLGAGESFLNDALKVKLSGDYSQDPYFDSDQRAMLTVTYTYDRSL